MDKFFKDSKGHWAIWQMPNVLLITWFLTVVLAKLLPVGRLERVVDLVAFGSLFAWAWLELFKGNSYFRRLLGAVVLIAIVVGRSK